MLRKTLDAMSNVGIGLKVKVMLICIGLLPPLAALLCLHQSGPDRFQNILALYVSFCIMLYYPLCRAMEELIVLRQTRQINEYVEGVKVGRELPSFRLPEEKGDEHDFLRLRRNIFWMVQGLKSREARLQDTLSKLETAQRQVLESIEYASRIQRSFLPSPKDLQEALGIYFLLWLPRDGVGGDAYWVKRVDGRTYLAVFDCTGHGVPGAFLTLIVNSLFEQCFDGFCRDNPARLLSKMNKGLKRALSIHGKKMLVDDGLEGGVCCLDRDGGILRFAGARGSLFLASAEGVREVKGDRSGVGFTHVPMDQEFVNHDIPLEGVIAVYLITDGITDQIGGMKRLPFGRRKLRVFLQEHAQLPISVQLRALEKVFIEHKGRSAQRDDVTVLGFSIKEPSC